VEHRLNLVQFALDRAAEEAQRRAALTDRLAVDIAGLAQSLQILSDKLDRLPGTFGPRFDELEIKVRPLIAFDDASYAVRLRDGYAMVPRGEPLFAVMVSNASSGGLEPGTRRVLTALIEPGMVVADVGANVGLLTLACAMATGPKGRVFAFEPEAGPRAQLEKTKLLNGLSWVDVLAVAVGATSGAQTFHVSPIIGHSSLYALPDAETSGGRDVQVQVRRLDDVIEPGGRLDVVKIDVEGAELDVVAGMRRVLAENPDLAIVAEYGPSHLERIGITPQAWFMTFENAGFEPYAIDETTGICRRVTPPDLKDVVSVNLAFVRSTGPAKARLPQ
jgi:FkbM family methyltransferase